MPDVESLPIREVPPPKTSVTESARQDPAAVFERFRQRFSGQRDTIKAAFQRLPSVQSIEPERAELEQQERAFAELTERARVQLAADLQPKSPIIQRIEKRITESDLQRLSDEHAERAKWLSLLSPEEDARRLDRLRQWMHTQKRDDTQYPTYKEGCLSLTSTEREAFLVWDKQQAELPHAKSEEEGAQEQVQILAESALATVKTEPPMSARMTLKEWWNSNSTDRIKHRITVLGSSQITVQEQAASLLLRDFRSMSFQPKDNRYTEAECKLLLDTLPTLVEITLREPRLHGKLIRAILSKYQDFQKDGEREAGKTLLREVLGRLNTSESVVDANKALFITRFLSTFNNLNFRDILHLPLIEEVKHAMYADIIDVLGLEGISYDFKGLQKGVFEDHIYSQDEATFRKRQAWNALSILALECTRPGICKRLREASGVSIFYRYPRETLLYFDEQLQLDKQGRRDKQRTLIVTAAYDDKNEPLSSLVAPLKRVKELEQHGIVPMMIEIGSVPELEYFVENIEDVVKDDIFQVIFFGHGTSDGIDLGENDILTKDPTQLGWVEDIFQLLPNVKQVLLNSCSTAGAIGDNFAKALGSALKREVVGYWVPLNHIYGRLAMRFEKSGIQIGNPLTKRYRSTELQVES